EGEPPIQPPLRTSTQRLAALRAAVERRRQRGWIDLRGYRLTTARDLARLLRPFRDPKVEVLHVLLLDNSNRVLSHTMETSGRIDFVHLAREIEMRLGIQERSDPERGASPRFEWEIVHRARRLGATRIVFAHNHPSGDPTPSTADVATTYKLARDFARHGLEVLGHVGIDDISDLKCGWASRRGAIRSAERAPASSGRSSTVPAASGPPGSSTPTITRRAIRRPARPMWRRRTSWPGISRGTASRCWATWSSMTL